MNQSAPNTVNPTQLRKDLLQATEQLMATLQSDGMSALLRANCPDLYRRTIDKYLRLKNQEYRIAVAAGMSAGKSSALNAFVLQYPLLPYCNTTTTCVPTVIRYGKKIRVEVSVRDKNDYKKETKRISLPCGKESVTQDQFNLLKEYFAYCYRVLALGNVDYFTKEPSFNYIKNKTNPSAGDLMLSGDNPRHVAMLMLTALCAYMENNEKDEVLSEEQLKARNFQGEVLKMLGLDKDDKLYIVTVYWDAPLLEKGLVFYDLPGLGADNTDQNGYLSHETITMNMLDEVQSMLYIYKHEITAEGLEAITCLLNSEAIRDLQSKQDRVIVAINKIDTIRSNSLDVAVANAATSLKKFNLSPRVYPISARSYGEYVFTENDVVRLENTYAAQYYLEDDEELEEAVESAKRRIARDAKKYPGEPFAAALNDYAENAIITNALEFIKSLHQLCATADREIMSLIKLYDIVGDDITAAGSAVKDMLVDLRTKTLAEFQDNSIKRIETAFEGIETKSSFQEERNKLKRNLTDEMARLRTSTLDYFHQQLSANILRDYVLYYEKRNGRIEKNEPNYSRWESFKNRVVRYKFQTTFHDYTAFLKELIKEIQKTCQSLNEEINSDISRSIASFSSVINQAVAETEEKLLVSLEGEIADKEAITEIYNRLLTVLERAAAQFGTYAAALKSDIYQSLTETDNTDQMNASLVKMANGVQKAMNEELLKLTSRLADNMEQKGVLRRHTIHLDRRKVLRYIEDNFVLTEEGLNQYIGAMNPVSKVRQFCSAGVEGKKAALTNPVKEFKTKIDNMVAMFTDNSQFGSVQDTIKSYLTLLLALSQQMECGSLLDDMIKRISEDGRWQSERDNVDGVDYAALDSEIRRNIKTVQEEMIC